jgi:tRNA (cmo5U34)-methyltransferase
MGSGTSAQPEKMRDFFDRRSHGYDEHMQQSVVSFGAFYAAVAQAIPCTRAVLQILDIGCGTGLELGPILERAPNAHITGIDLSGEMLARLRAKYEERAVQITLIEGSYLDVPFETARYDYAVSAMTLHHLLPERKGRLYKRVRHALRAGGRYVEGDYTVTKEEEARALAAYRERIEPAGDLGEGMYHVDIPLAMETQHALLRQAGFSRVEVSWHEGKAAVYVADAGKSSSQATRSVAVRL